MLGVEKRSMIFVLNTNKALENFTSGKRKWEFGVDTSISVVRVGAGGDIDTTNLQGDILSFILLRRDSWLNRRKSGSWL